MSKYKPTEMSVSQLFGDKGAYYRIAEYQRPYRWGTEEVEKLWSDLYDAFKANSDDYFLGSIVTSSGKDGFLEVIDGQQRLTTLTLFLCSVRDMFPDISISEGKPQEINKGVLVDMIHFQGKTARLRLQTHPTHHSVFNKIISGDVKAQMRPAQKDLDLPEAPEFKFMNTAAIFCEKLKDLTLNEVNGLVDFILNKAEVIRVDCQDFNSAIKLFRVINDRGLDLTEADLIKTGLLEGIADNHEDGLSVNEVLKANFMQDWRWIEQASNTTGVEMDRFFMMYRDYFLNVKPVKELKVELLNAVKDKDPLAVISDLKDYVSSYMNNIHEIDDKNVFALKYLRWDIWESVLVTAYHIKYPQMQELILTMRRYYYLSWIAGRTLDFVRSASYKVIEHIKRKSSVDVIKKLLDDQMTEGHIVSDVQRNLLENVAGKPWCRPLLYAVEYELSDGGQFNAIDGNIHIEHILPVKYAKIQQWGHITPLVGDMWLNKLANLTLLSGTKNIQASNSPFEEKMKVYKGKGKYGDKNPGITMFCMTQQLYLYHDKRSQWDETALIARSNWLMDRIGKILDIDLSGLKKKINENWEDWI